MALPIPFDGFGTLEVDPLCADAPIAIELDDGQHLADPVAYRRDRRKDQLLQENGYFVLRFLAEDIGKDLDAVLDAILVRCSASRLLRPRVSAGAWSAWQVRSMLRDVPSAVCRLVHVDDAACFAAGVIRDDKRPERQC